MQTHEQHIDIDVCATVYIFIVYSVTYIYLIFKKNLITHRKAQMWSSEAVSYDTVALY